MFNSDFFPTPKDVIYKMARCLICCFTRKYTKMMVSEIGVMIGGRDHSTVIYQIDQYPHRHEYEERFRRYAGEVERVIKENLK